MIMAAGEVREGTADPDKQHQDKCLYDEAGEGVQIHSSSCSSCTRQCLWFYSGGDDGDQIIRPSVNIRTHMHQLIFCYTTHIRYSGESEVSRTFCSREESVTSHIRAEKV
jgi:hypothetical protein